MTPFPSLINHETQLDWTIRSLTKGTVQPLSHCSHWLL